MRQLLSTLWDTGLRLRCPVCEQGTLFHGWFTMHPLCPHCSVRFERDPGEVVGGMGISIVVTAVIFLVAYLAVEMATQWPVWVHFAIWIPFAILFPIGFYRHSRALWVILLHREGHVFWDQEPYDTPDVSIVDAFFKRQPDDEPPAPPPFRFPEEDDDLLPLN